MSDRRGAFYFITHGHVVVGTFEEDGVQLKAVRLDIGAHRLHHNGTIVPVEVSDLQVVVDVERSTGDGLDDVHVFEGTSFTYMQERGVKQLVFGPADLSAVHFGRGENEKGFYRTLEWCINEPEIFDISQIVT